MVTGLGLKLALVFFGNPLALRLTELDPPTVPTDTATFPRCPRLTINEVGDAEIVKSAAAGCTVSVKLLEWTKLPLLPTIVIV